MSLATRHCSILLATVLAVAAAAAAQTGAPPPDASPAEVEADRLFRAQEWDAAARAYGALAQTANPRPRFLLRQGTALAAVHQDAAAVPLLERAVAGGVSPLAVGLQLPRLQARLGRVDAALASLSALTSSGFGGNGQLQQMAADPDLAAVRRDARYDAIFTAADRNARPCLYAPEYRQLDFWIGEWDVTLRGSPPATPPSSSSIQSILDGCVILESWQSNGYAGRSFNQYDAAARKWRQFWVDSQGGYLTFEGEAREGNLYYVGETPAQGATPATKHKLTFFRQGTDEVRQLWEQSVDGGATWTVAFDGIYRRRTRAR